MAHKQTLFEFTGMITTFTKLNNIPNGWLICNGRTISKNGVSILKGPQYKNIYNILKYGWGNNPSSDWDSNDIITLPDLTNAFLRGRDSMDTAEGNASVDPDGSRNIGDIQTQLLKAHTHVIGIYNSGYSHSAQYWSLNDPTGGPNKFKSSPPNVTYGANLYPKHLKLIYLIKI